MLVKGALTSALFIALISCSRPCQKWSIDKTVTRCPSFNSGKISLKPACLFGEIELEIAQGPCEQRMYLNVFALEFPSLPEDPAKAKVIISFEDRESITYGFKLQGGQRLLLPDETAQEITAALLEGQSFCLKVGKYESTIIPNGFQRAFQELNSIPRS